jgi:hypothetical protein
MLAALIGLLLSAHAATCNVNAPPDVGPRLQVSVEVIAGEWSNATVVWLRQGKRGLKIVVGLIHWEDGSEQENEMVVYQRRCPSSRTGARPIPGPTAPRQPAFRGADHQSS